jgi:hypothetical protein
MLEELKISDTTANAERLFVRAELYPANNDFSSDISEWVFNVDQDITPDWFVRDYERQRMIDAVKAWAKNHIFIGVDNLTLPVGGVFFVKNCKNVTVTNSTVKAWDNSTVKALGNSTVEAWGNSVVVKPTYSMFDTDRLILSENSTFKDCTTKTIFQSGDFKLVSVTDGKVKKKGGRLSGFFKR